MLAGRNANVGWPNHDLYEAAALVCNSREDGKCPTNIRGLTATLKGTELDFVLILSIEPSKINLNDLTKYEEALKTLNMKISNETDANAYKKLINDENNPYVRRIKLLENNTSAENIYVLTYMDSAAKHFKEKLLEFMPDLKILPNISTINGLCLKILKDNSNEMNSTIIPLYYQEFEDVFSKESADILPEHSSYDCRIDLVPGSKLHYGPIYPLTEREDQALKEYIDDNPDLQFVASISSSLRISVSHSSVLMLKSIVRDAFV